MPWQIGERGLACHGHGAAPLRERWADFREQCDLADPYATGLCRALIAACGDGDCLHALLHDRGTSYDRDSCGSFGIQARAALTRWVDNRADHAPLPEDAVDLRLVCDRGPGQGGQLLPARVWVDDAHSSGHAPHPWIELLPADDRWWQSLIQAASFLAAQSIGECRLTWLLQSDDHRPLSAVGDSSASAGFALAALQAQGRRKRLRADSPYADLDIVPLEEVVVSGAVDAKGHLSPVAAGTLDAKIRAVADSTFIRVLVLSSQQQTSHSQRASLLKGNVELISSDNLQDLARQLCVRYAGRYGVALSEGALQPLPADAWCVERPSVETQVAHIVSAPAGSGLHLAAPALWGKTWLLRHWLSNGMALADGAQLEVVAATRAVRESPTRRWAWNLFLDLEARTRRRLRLALAANADASHLCTLAPEARGPHAAAFWSAIAEATAGRRWLMLVDAADELYDLDSFLSLLPSRMPDGVFLLLTSRQPVLLAPAAVPLRSIAPGVGPGDTAALAALFRSKWCAEHDHAAAMALDAQLPVLLYRAGGRLGHAEAVLCGADAQPIGQREGLIASWSDGGTAASDSLVLAKVITSTMKSRGMDAQGLVALAILIEGAQRGLGSSEVGELLYAPNGTFLPRYALLAEGCTLSVEHLPDLKAFAASWREAARVLGLSTECASLSTISGLWISALRAVCASSFEWTGHEFDRRLQGTLAVASSRFWTEDPRKASPQQLALARYAWTHGLLHAAEAGLATEKLAKRLFGEPKPTALWHLILSPAVVEAAVKGQGPTDRPWLDLWSATVERFAKDVDADQTQLLLHAQAAVAGWAGHVAAGRLTVGSLLYHLFGAMPGAVGPVRAAWCATARQAPLYRPEGGAATDPPDMVHAAMPAFDPAGLCLASHWHDGIGLWTIQPGSGLPRTAARPDVQARLDRPIADLACLRAWGALWVATLETGDGPWLTLWRLIDDSLQPLQLGRPAGAGPARRTAVAARGGGDTADGIVCAAVDEAGMAWIAEVRTDIDAAGQAATAWRQVGGSVGPNAHGMLLTRACDDTRDWLLLVSGARQGWGCRWPANSSIESVGPMSLQAASVPAQAPSLVTLADGAWLAGLEGRGLRWQPDPDPARSTVLGLWQRPLLAPDAEPQRAWLATGRELLAVDLRERRAEVVRPMPPDEVIDGLAASPDGRHVVLSIRPWAGNTRLRWIHRPAPNPPTDAAAAVFSAATGMAACWAGPDGLFVWSSKSGASPVPGIEGGSVTAIHAAGDGRFLVGVRGQGLFVLQADTAKLDEAPLAGPTGNVAAICSHLGGERLLARRSLQRRPGGIHRLGVDGQVSHAIWPGDATACVSAGATGVIGGANDGQWLMCRPGLEPLLLHRHAAGAVVDVAAAFAHGRWWLAALWFDGHAATCSVAPGGVVGAITHYDAALRGVGRVAVRPPETPGGQPQLWARWSGQGVARWAADAGGKVCLVLWPAPQRGFVPLDWVFDGQAIGAAPVGLIGLLDWTLQTWDLGPGKPATLRVRPGECGGQGAATGSKRP